VPNRSKKGGWKMVELRAWWARQGAWERWAIAVWTVIVLAAVGRAGLISRARHKGCYSIFAEGGRHWAAGEDLYTPRPGLDVFRNGPIVAVFCVPCGLLPDIAGSALLRAANCLVFLAGLFCWSRHALPRTLSPAQRAALFLLVVPLGARSLIDIQLNGLAIGLLLLGMAALARQRWSLAALGIALACFCKGYPLALALLLMAVHPWRFTGRFVVALLVWALLPFALQRPDYVLHQCELWSRWGLNNRGAELLVFQDLRLLAHLLGGRLSAPDYLKVQVFAGTALAGLCLLARWRSVSCGRLYTMLFLLSTGWMMAFGPATEVTTYIFFAPASAYLLLEAGLEGSRWRRAAHALAWCIFATAQLALWFPGGSQINGFAPYVIATLLMMATLALTEVGRLLPESLPAPAEVGQVLPGAVYPGRALPRAPVASGVRSGQGTFRRPAHSPAST
jgi:hypothetical protein